MEIAADQLKGIVERIEKLTEEKKEISEYIREVYAEAKGNGFDPKALRQVIKLRAMEKAEREAQEAIVDTYSNVLGL